jgi:hypothetical protein
MARLPSMLVGPQAKSGGYYFRSLWLKPGIHRWYKKQAHRKMRRLAKADPEGAPRKYYYAGWAD